MTQAGDAARDGVVIRLAVARDAAAISEMVSRLTRVYVLPEQPEGVEEKLLAWMTTEAIAERIAMGHSYHVAESAGALAGVAAIRDNAHLYLLFVERRSSVAALRRRSGRLRLPPASNQRSRQGSRPMHRPSPCLSTSGSASRRWGPLSCATA